MNDLLTIGIDLGGTSIKGVLINSEGQILKNRATDTLDGHSGTGKFWKENIFNMVQSFRKEYGEKIQRSGLAAPGLASADNRSIAFMPQRLQGLENFDLGEFLELETYALNDAHAHLIAEARFGAGIGYKNIVLITLGTGVGGAIMIDGELYQGEIGRAGHLGHLSINQSEVKGITGTPGSLENAIGDCTIKERTEGQYNSTRELVRDFNLGNDFASQVWLKSLESLARGIVSLINILSPQLIILGGGITEAREALMNPLKNYIDEYEWCPGGHKTEIKFASKGIYAGALGAAIFAMTH